MSTKNVLITGAGGSLGRACVQQFVNEGYQALAVLSPGKKLDFGSGVTVYNADLEDEKKTEALIEEVVRKHQSIDIAIFTVGGFAMGDISKTTGADINSMIALNFNTAYYIARNVLAQMKNQSHGARMVFVGARPVTDANAGKGMIAYTLSKTMVMKLTELINAEGKDKHIVATTVIPSIIDTEANRKSMPKADFSKWVTPEAIAGAIFFTTTEAGATLREPVLKMYSDV